jgi:hypothetical protein
MHCSRPPFLIILKRSSLGTVITTPITNSSMRDRREWNADAFDERVRKLEAVVSM